MLIRLLLLSGLLLATLPLSLTKMLFKSNHSKYIRVSILLSSRIRFLLGPSTAFIWTETVENVMSMVVVASRRHWAIDLPRYAHGISEPVHGPAVIITNQDHDKLNITEKIE
ncbi:hypothetical protein Micbo1qcDRAFT_180404 [Microdochium bolleyi]|uniref:Secreted protein n=1 Tax=Microdochium bolleyi TaxID=196109 RepID=A0A136ILK3_9PEZI|nr:hypothetical protein Micbo1qcDRAFT_180404 [Microdochium bolleyi]